MSTDQLENAIYILKLSPNKAKPKYDILASVVLIAPNELDARFRASKEAGDEGQNIWLNPNYTTCEIVDATSEARIILRDFRAG